MNLSELSVFIKHLSTAILNTDDQSANWPAMIILTIMTDSWLYQIIANYV